MAEQTQGGRKPYQRGYRLEYRTKKALEERGCLVIGARSSRGPFDLWALRPSAFARPVVLLIQCKLDGRLSKAGQRELASLADKYGAAALLVSRDKAWRLHGESKTELPWPGF